VAPLAIVSAAINIYGLLANLGLMLVCLGLATILNLTTKLILRKLHQRQIFHKE